MSITHKIQRIFIIAISFVLSACMAPPPPPPAPVNLPPPIPPLTNTFRLPPGDQDVVGTVLEVPMQKDDTLSGMAQAHDITVGEIYAANPGIDIHKIVLNTKIIVPKQYVLPPKPWRQGIVINIPELRIYYFDAANHSVMTFPVALGRVGWHTPIANTKVVRKQANPVWYAPASVRAYLKGKYNKNVAAIVPAGPDNPLGKYALYLALQGYLIHGTDEPASVGNLVSSGCVRLYAADIQKLFNAVKIGTPVAIIHQPYKVGVLGNDVYLEVHPPINSEERVYQEATISVEQAINDRLNGKADIDWQKVEDVAKAQTGVPTIVGHLHDENAVAPEPSVGGKS